MNFPITVYGNLENLTDVMSIGRCRIFYKYGKLLSQAKDKWWNEFCVASDLCE